jgi:hypothetical protein
MKSRNRYIFLDYNLLQNLDIKTLEKVSDRIYIIADSHVKDIPFKLVKRIQKHGKRFRWIATSAETADQLNHHLFLTVGQCHAKAEKNLEFAIISNDELLDPLIEYLNLKGRDCLRIETTDSTENIDDFSSYTFAVDSEGDLKESKNAKQIRATVRKIVDRLQQSGNRPAEVSTLKSYILLHHDESNVFSYLDDIILEMEESRDIEINEGEVVYNF